MSDDILFKEPWPSQGIYHYHSIEDGAWGYLIYHKTQGFIFDSSRTPPPEEILQRWGYHFSRMTSDAA